MTFLKAVALIGILSLSTTAVAQSNRLANREIPAVATAKGTVTGALANPATTSAPEAAAPMAAPQPVATALLPILLSLLPVMAFDISLPTKPID